MIEALEESAEEFASACDSGRIVGNALAEFQAGDSEFFGGLGFEELFGFEFGLFEDQVAGDELRPPPDHQGIDDSFINADF